MSTKAALLRPSRPPAYERMMTDACPPADLHQSLSADVAGHRLELIFDGGDRLTRLLDLINGAAHSVDLIMYIFEGDAKSEEHTSELQSLMRISYAVFCLKKKTQTTIIRTIRM